MTLDSVEYYAGVRVESLNVKEANSRKAVNSCWQLVEKGVGRMYNRVNVLCVQQTLWIESCKLK